MIRTNDAVAAMLFMVHARRLGLDPAAMEDGRGWALETVRGRELAEVLWEMISFEVQGAAAGLTLLDLQESLDRRHWQEREWQATAAGLTLS